MNKSDPTNLHIENLYRHFPDEKSRVLRPVLENVDLRVAPGEFVTIVGPSGCGKTTLLRICLGADFGYQGIVRINNNPVSFPDARRGLVPQKYALFDHLTVFENVLIGLQLKHPIWYRFQHRRELRERAMSYLNEIGMVEHADKYPHQLSGGQRQRVSIAQALISDPEIVLMDEPFGALDPSTRERMQVFLLDLWEKRKMTIFFVTHDVPEAVYLGTRTVLLSQYYTDDRGDDQKVVRGSKIVRDLALSGSALPTKAKGEKAYTEMVRNIMDGPGFKPDHRVHVRDFDLRHPYSFQSLTSEEDNQRGNGSAPHPI